jgi:hypothetical protein
MIMFSVECRGCGNTLAVEENTFLWQRAKAAVDAGLGVASVRPVECGCRCIKLNPYALYRVIGFTSEGREYDVPFDSFVGAIRAFRYALGCGGVVMIQGVSRAVVKKLCGE